MILFKTDKGQQVLKDRSVRLTPRQRSMFILFDGQRSVAEVLQASQGAPEDVGLMVQLGLLAQPAGAPAVAAVAAADAEPIIEIHPHSVMPAPFSETPAETGTAAAQRVEPVFESAPVPLVPPVPSPPASADAAPAVLSTQQRFHRAYPIATQLTASLGARGLRLNLAAEAATSLEQLIRLRPKIRAALGAERTAPLDTVLGY